MERSRSTDFQEPISGVLRRALLKRVIRSLYAEAALPAPVLKGSYRELVLAADRFEEVFGGGGALSSAGIRVIERVLPPPVSAAARLVIHNPAVTGKIAVLVVPPAIRWLVGDVERRMYRNRAVIHRCAFLEASGSVSQCIYLCKGPSERFFSERLNIDMKMKPNLNSGECVLTFGPEAAGAASPRRGG